jgi:transcriptional regulator with XRE-family HTH domain
MKRSADVARKLRTNILYACWQRTHDQGQWVGLLSSWLQPGSPKTGAELQALRQILESFLLGDCEFDFQQAELIARSLNHDVQDLLYEDWAASKPGLILRENLKRLLGNSGSSTKNELARELQVSRATVSRWISGRQQPDRRARTAIAGWFGLHRGEDLEQLPLFLSYAPVTHAERIAWVQAQLVEASSRRLAEIFPALRRLLG